MSNYRFLRRGRTRSNGANKAARHRRPGSVYHCRVWRWQFIANRAHAANCAGRRTLGLHRNPDRLNRWRVPSRHFVKRPVRHRRPPPEKVVQKNLATARRDPPLRDPPRADPKAGPGGSPKKCGAPPESRPISYSERPPGRHRPRRFLNSDPAAPSSADADQDRETRDAPVSAERVEGGYSPSREIAPHTAPSRALDGL